MKNYLGILFFLFFISKARSQNTMYPSGYTFCDWDKIAFTPNYNPIPGDTAIIFVSTRTYFPDKEFFLSYDFDTSNTLHCFTIYFNQNKWICVPRKDLTE